MVTIGKLEQFVEDHMPKYENRSGVKTRKQFYSSFVFADYSVSETESNKLEATSDAVSEVLRGGASKHFIRMYK